MVLVQKPRRPRDVNRRSSGCRPGAWELVAPGRRSHFPGPRHGPRAYITPPLLARPRPVILLCGDQDHMATPADKSSLFAPALTRHGTQHWTIEGDVARRPRLLRQGRLRGRYAAAPHRVQPEDADRLSAGRRLLCAPGRVLRRGVGRAAAREDSGGCRHARLGGPDRRARQRARHIAPRRAERRDRPSPTAAGTPDESDALGLPDNA